jgi:soluble lytic murein transglycosylase-like protein
MPPSFPPATHPWILVLALATTLGAGLLPSDAPERPDQRGPVSRAPETVAPVGFIRAATADDHAVRVAAFARRYGITPGLSRQIYDAARAERVSPALAFGLVRVESGFDPAALGLGGAIGLTQIRPATARELVPKVQRSDLYSPHLNLRLGFRYLHALLERFDQDVALALAAYNRGPSQVEELLAQGRTPGGAYARKVLRNVEPGSSATL